jgi:type II secretory pathway pseudopilin PulG
MVILVTIIGLVGAATLKIDGLLRRAAAEEELLFAGAAFADALTSYAAATPQGQPTQPPSLQELLRDTRTPAVRRHLRKIFIDPMTNSTDWGIVWLADGKGVLAVYSKSQAQPLKIGNFDTKLVGFEGNRHISEWRFAATGPAPLVPQVAVPVKTSLFPAAGAGAPAIEASATAAPANVLPATAAPANVVPSSAAPPKQEVPPETPVEPPKAEAEAVVDEELRQRPQDETAVGRQQRD